MPHIQLHSISNNKNKNNIHYPLKLTRSYIENSPFSWWLSAGESKLPPEVERDNVEYKWKLVGMSEERRIHLVTQMRWRVGELGYCWYIIGVKDNGDLEGLKESDFKATMDVLRDIVRGANLIITECQMISLLKKSNLQEKYICQVRIELEASEHLKSLEIRVNEQRAVVLGASGSGKTTLLSVLSDWGRLDDGSGLMRTRLLHHRHELLSGSTSSITHQPLVFPADKIKIPLALCADESLLLQLERRREILSEGRVMQMVDSGGKLRFDRTVFSVLTTVSTGPSPQTALLLLNSTEPVPSSSLETFKLLRALSLSTAVVVSKIDQSSTEAITALLESFSQSINEPLQIYSEHATQVEEQGGIPVLLVSSVSGDYLDTLCHFLHSRFNRPPESPRSQNNFLHAQEFASSAFFIEQVVAIESVGTVVYGQVAFGSINVGDEMILGPQEGPNTPPNRLRIKSIQRLKCPVNAAHTSQHVSLALDCSQATGTLSIKKGMALFLPKPKPPQNSSSSLSLKPLRRIIAEMNQISGSLPQQQCRHFKGVIYVMGQRFSAVLDVQARGLTKRATQKTSSNRLICLVSFPEKRPACVFLFPSAPIIFISDGRREKFAGTVLDYFALARKICK